jgi:hypothetical protein
MRRNGSRKHESTKVRKHETRSVWYRKKGRAFTPRPVQAAGNRKTALLPRGRRRLLLLMRGTTPPSGSAWHRPESGPFVRPRGKCARSTQGRERCAEGSPDNRPAQKPAHDETLNSAVLAEPAMIQANAKIAHMFNSRMTHCTVVAMTVPRKFCPFGDKGYLGERSCWLLSRHGDHDAAVVNEPGLTPTG